MRLRRFSVAGYKNLEQPIVLDDLGPINVIHGPNNVGKSNLLEAMALFFQLGRAEAVGARAPDVRSMFDLYRPAPIVLSGVLDIPADELRVAGMAGAPTVELDVEIKLAWDAVNAAATTAITRFRFDDGVDLAPNLGSTLNLDNDVESARKQFFPPFLTSNVSAHEGPSQRFSIVGVHRGLEEVTVQRRGGPVPLAVEMYDCRESSDRVRRDRWRAFVRAMERFQDVTGAGAFEVTYQRADTQARLVFDTDRMRIPLGLLGTGVQQVAALLGNLLVRNASIVGIEEPELNLRWDLQNRLREALKKLVSEPHGTGGIDQIFLTSHSPAFETGESFLLMEPGPKGPRVTRRPASELPAVLGTGAQHLGLPERAPQSYVTSQGVVRLPPDVVERLHVEKGGGVFFIDTEPRGVRILSDNDYLDEMGLVDAPEPPDAGR